MKAGGGKGGTFHSPVEKKPLCGQESREHREWSAQDTHKDANVGCRAVCVNSARTVPRGVRGVIPASTQESYYLSYWEMHIMKGRKPNPNRPRYASMIAEARAAKGWTQADLGAAIGKDAATIKKYEGGSRIPPFNVLYDICEVLGINVFDVMDLDLRCGDSTGYHQFVDESFSEVESLISDVVYIRNLSEIGVGTDDLISIQFGGKEGYTSKMTFVLEVEAIKRRLKAKYDEELSKAVCRLAVDIAEGKGEKEDVEAVSLSGEQSIIKVRKPKY